MNNARQYHIVFIRDVDGQITYMTKHPMDHKHCCTMMSKISKHKHGRFQLLEVESVG